MAASPVQGFSGPKLRTLRGVLGLTQQDLSDKTARSGRRVKRTRIGLYENGKEVPSALHFGALVRALECGAEELLADDAVRAA